MIALWVALDKHSSDEHALYNAHNGGFVTASDVRGACKGAADFAIKVPMPCYQVVY
jgi:hypothetical protein